MWVDNDDFNEIIVSATGAGCLKSFSETIWRNFLLPQKLRYPQPTRNDCCIDWD
jgi:hypothetical protein